jgi:2-(1,2-epoxy-1,2-dihydrophenyl)acetyl-CoA isomerase
VLGRVISLDSVRIEVDRRVATVILARPGTRNAMDADLLEDLGAAMSWCAGRDDLTAVVVRGTETDFSVGGDLESLRQGLLDPEDERSQAGNLAALLSRSIVAIDEMPCPVVAAVDGRAGGAGFSLALACDARVASSRAVFDFAYARLGVTPDGGMTWFLPQIVGRSQAAQMLLESPIIRATRALELGLVREVVAPADLVCCARRLAEKMGRNPPDYLASVRRLIREADKSDLATQLGRERRALEASMQTEEARRRILKQP